MLQIPLRSRVLDRQRQEWNADLSLVPARLNFEFGGSRAMSDDRSTITIPRDAFAAVMDSIQRAIIDKGASKATRKAAFSVLLALIEAGLVADDTATLSTANKASVAQTHAATRRLLAG
jgi:hypothetical protein